MITSVLDKHYMGGAHMDIDGEALRRIRERKLITQAELAEKSGITISTLSRLENGLQQARISTVRKLALALGVNADEILGEPDEGKLAA
jgi:transcriptional regulator with XRE-family HTH domain